MLNRGFDRLNEKERRKRFHRELQRSLDAEKLVAEVIGARNVEVQQTRTGTQIIHSCPLPWGLHRHGDTDASAAFNADLLVFHCFVCGGGDIFWYVQSVLEVGAKEAERILGELVDPGPMSKQELVDKFRTIWEEGDEPSFSMPEYSPAILDRWKVLSPYLTNERGVSPETQKEMSTGVDVHHRERFKKGDIDTWVEQPRVVIPLFWGGKLRGWQKRRISDEKPTLGPKYRTTPGLPKSETLYGLDYCDGDELVYVVESPLTVLRMRSVGYTSVVATMGADVSDEQIDQIREFDEVILLFDGDPAGVVATERVTHAVKDFSKVWTWQFVDQYDNGLDPADFNPASLSRAIDDKMPAIVWLAWRN